jgi:hypothetical protein
MMWLLEKLYMAEVDFNRCIFGILPVGRNNDLSRSLGWGGSLYLTSDFVEFKEIVREIAEASSVFIDIWDIKLTCAEGGEIVEVNNDGKKTKIENGKVMTTFKKSFISYFSLGYEARVGFGFKKHKTTSRCKNFMSYLWEASKKLCCRKTLKVKGFLDSFYTVKMEDNLAEELDSQAEITIRENEAPKETIFRSIDDNNNNILQKENFNSNDTNNMINLRINNKQITIKDKKCKLNIFILDDNIILKGDPINIYCQNINYLSGGCANVWRRSEEKFGLEIYDPKLDKKDKKAIEVIIIIFIYIS